MQQEQAQGDELTLTHGEVFMILVHRSELSAAEIAAGLLLSPLWGAVVVLASDSKEAAAHRARLEQLFAAIVVEEEE